MRSLDARAAVRRRDRHAVERGVVGFGEVGAAAPAEVLAVLGHDQDAAAHPLFLGLDERDQLGEDGGQRGAGRDHL